VSGAAIGRQTGLGRFMPCDISRSLCETREQPPLIFHFERAGQRRMLAIAQMPESALLRGSRLFCIATVSIVCTIKAPVPVRAEDLLDPRYLDGR